jgi:uncharacterized protein (TIRG00374 family)
MILKRKSLSTRTIPFVLLGLLAFLLYLVFFVNIDEMILIIGRTNFPIYLLAVVSTVVEMVFFALAWHYFLKPLSAKVSLKKAFIYSWGSIFTDLLVPAESVTGEISRIYFIAHDGVDTGKAVASIVTQRILGMLIIISSLVVGVLQTLLLKSSFPSLVQSLMFFVVAANAVFLFLILLICFKQSWTYKLIEKLIAFAERIGHGRWNIEEWRDKARKAISAFYDSLKIFASDPEKLILPVAFSIFSWFFSILVYYFVFAAIGYTIDWFVLIIVYSLVIALKSIPVGVPAEVGVTEIAMTTLFMAFNVPQPISAAATVLIRIVTVWFRLVIGFGAIQWVGVKTLMESETLVGQKKEM